jgi:hypothetical protein
MLHETNKKDESVALYKKIMARDVSIRMLVG